MNRVSEIGELDEVESESHLLFYFLSLLVFISKARKRRQGNLFDKRLLIYLEAQYCFPLNYGFEPQRCS